MLAVSEQSWGPGGQGQASLADNIKSLTSHWGAKRRHIKSLRVAYGAPIGPTCSNLGPTWLQDGLMLGPCCGMLGLAVKSLGPRRGQWDRYWGRRTPLLGSKPLLGNTMCPSWAHVGPSWAKLGPCWAQVGAMLANVGAMLWHLALILNI